ncbi:TlpA family protein disulfide reductase [Chitinophaga sedimenti]|nr:TlpA family protein disulfide reductase [Chitinophaga sedimenti]
MDNRRVTLDGMKGKVVFVDFWFTGCGPCKMFYQKCLKLLEEKYKSRKDIVFVKISVDRSKENWLKSVESGEYTSLSSINLFTDGLGSSHDIIKFYKVRGYPWPVLIDKKGRIVRPKRIIDLKTRWNLNK